jgi:hypothetical protein
MRVLELFSGTGSISKICEKLGWEVVSIDINAKFATPTKIEDIMLWDYKADYPVGHFDIITASPPCHTFSSLRYCWLGRVMKKFAPEPTTLEMLENDMLKNGVPLLNKTREIIEYFKPSSYWIENPSAGRMREFIKDIPVAEVSYCQYGFKYRKNTKIWNNFSFQGKKCDGKNKHTTHKFAIGGQASNCVSSLAERYSIPPELVKDLLISAMNNALASSQIKCPLTGEL